jgi:hypothetical protein
MDDSARIWMRPVRQTAADDRAAGGIGSLVILAFVQPAHVLKKDVVEVWGVLATLVPSKPSGGSSPGFLGRRGGTTCVTDESARANPALWRRFCSA